VMAGGEAVAACQPGLDSSAMQVMRVSKLKWGLGKSLGSWVGHRHERRCEFTGGFVDGRFWYT
jgi:hypothetical protein